MTFKDQGLVIRETPLGESDRLLTVLLLERGVTTLRARGARKPTSPLLSARLFAFGEFVIYQGRGFLSLTQINPLSHFNGFFEDFERLSAACWMAKLTEKMVLPGMAAHQSLPLIVRGLRALDRGRPHPSAVCGAYALRLLLQEGFAPHQMDGFRDTDLIAAINYILSADTNRIFSFSLPAGSSRALFGVATEILRTELNLDMPLNI